MGSSSQRAAFLEPAWRLVPVALVSIAVVAKTLAAFARIIEPYLAIHYDVWFELGMVTGQVLFQWLVLWRGSWNDRLYYGGVLLTVSTLGAVLIWPLLMFHHRSPVTPVVGVVYFMGVVAIIFAAHAVLVMRAKLPPLLCATWVIYRLLILAVAVKQ